MLKKWIALITAGVLAMSVAACSNGADEATVTAPEQAEEGKVVVKLWRHEGTPSESTYYNDLVEKFNTSHENIELEVTSLPDNTYGEQVNAAILSGDLPDILDLDGPQMAGFVNAGALTSLDEYTSDELLSDVLPSLIAQGTYDDGKLYALGQFESGLSFWGNKSYLENAGVRIPTLDEPWDQVEFLDALDKLKALEEVEYPLDIKMNYGSGYWVYSYLPWVASFGGDYFDRDNFQAEGAMNSEASVKAFEFIQGLVNDGYINANQSTDDDFYGSKTAALALVGHWMYPTHTSPDGLGEDAILIPFPDFGNGVFTGSGSWAWGMTKNAKDRGADQAAWEVIEYLMSKEAIEGVFAANGAVPGRISVLEEQEEYKEGGVLYLYREQLVNNHSRVRPITPTFGVIQTMIGEAAINIIDGADAQAELDKAVKEIDQTIEDNGYHGK